MNFGIFFLELMVLTNADLISWNRGWNGVFRFSKGKQSQGRPASSIDIPGYTRQLNSFIRNNYKAKGEKSKMIVQLQEKLNDLKKMQADDADLTSRANDFEMKKSRKFSKNRYDRFENFKDHYLRFQLP